MAAGICVSLGSEIDKLNVDDKTRSDLLHLYLDKANLAAYEGKPYSIGEFIAEVKEEMNNDAS